MNGAVTVSWCNLHALGIPWRGVRMMVYAHLGWLEQLCVRWAHRYDAFDRDMNYDRAYVACAEGGHVTLFEWLRARGPYSDEFAVMPGVWVAAARNERIDFMAFLKRCGFGTFAPDAVLPGAIASRGVDRRRCSLAAIQWLHVTGGFKLPEQCQFVRYCARDGRVDVLDWYMRQCGGDGYYRHAADKLLALYDLYRYATPAARETCAWWIAHFRLPFSQCWHCGTGSDERFVWHRCVACTDARYCSAACRDANAQIHARYCRHEFAGGYDDGVKLNINLVL